MRPSAVLRLLNSEDRGGGLVSTSKLVRSQPSSQAPSTAAACVRRFFTSREPPDNGGKSNGAGQPDGNTARDKAELQAKLREAFKDYRGTGTTGGAGPVDESFQRVIDFIAELNRMDHLSVVRTLLPVLTEELGPSANALSLYPALTALSSWQSTRRDPKWLPGMPATGNNASLHEHVGLLALAYRAIKWATAAYGWKGEAFFKATDPGASFGFRDVPSLLRASVAGDAASFCRLAGVDRDRHLLLESPESTIGCPKHYIAVDEASKCIVLAIRGTMSLSDALTDAIARRVAFAGGEAHEGIAHAAHATYASVIDILTAELKRRPGYGLLVTGHSLGSASSILFTILLLHHRAKHLRDRQLPRELIPFYGVDVKCVGFGTPPVFAPSSALTEEMSSCIVNFVHNEDVVSRLSLDSLKDLMRVLGKVGNALPPLHVRVIKTFTSTSTVNDEAAMVDAVLKDEPEYLRSWTGKEGNDGQPPATPSPGPSPPPVAAAGGGGSGKSPAPGTPTSVAADKRPRLRIPGTIYCFRAPVDVDASVGMVDEPAAGAASTAGGAPVATTSATTESTKLPPAVEREVIKQGSDSDSGNGNVELGLMRGWAKEEAIAGGSNASPGQAAATIEEQAAASSSPSASPSLQQLPPSRQDSMGIGTSMSLNEWCGEDAAVPPPPSPAVPLGEGETTEPQAPATAPAAPSADAVPKKGEATTDATSSSSSSSSSLSFLRSLASSTVSGIGSAVSAVASTAAAAASTTTGAVGSMLGAGSRATPTPTPDPLPAAAPSSANDSGGDNIRLKPGIVETAAARAQQPLSVERPFITVVGPDELGHLPVTNNAYRHHVPDMYLFSLKQLYELAVLQQQQQQQQQRRGQGQGLERRPSADATLASVDPATDAAKAKAAGMHKGGEGDAASTDASASPSPEGFALGIGPFAPVASTSTDTSTKAAAQGPSAMKPASPAAKTMGLRISADNCSNGSNSSPTSNKRHFSSSAVAASPFLGSILQGGQGQRQRSGSSSGGSSSSAAASPVMLPQAASTNFNLPPLALQQHPLQSPLPLPLPLPLPALQLQYPYRYRHIPLAAPASTSTSTSTSTGTLGIAAGPYLGATTALGIGPASTTAIVAGPGNGTAPVVTPAFVAIDTRSEKVGASKETEEEAVSLPLLATAAATTPLAGTGTTTPSAPSTSLSPSPSASAGGLMRPGRAATADALALDASVVGRAGASPTRAPSLTAAAAVVASTPVVTSGQDKGDE